MLTRTALCAGLITKVQILKEEGEIDAAALVGEERAQQAAQPNAVQIMLDVEKTILDTAEKVQMERLREDRHLCAPVADPTVAPAQAFAVIRPVPPLSTRTATAGSPGW